MAYDRPPGPPADDEPTRWQDHDTEPIPRIRPDGPGIDRPATSPSGSTSGGAYFGGGEPLSFTEEEFSGLRGLSSAPPPVSTRRVLPLENQASTMVEKYLFPSEKYRGEWKRHPIQLLKEAVVGIGATVLMGTATGFLAKNQQESLLGITLLVWGVVMFWVGWRIADWYYDRFILTNKRVMVIKGLITRDVGMMPLLRVTDMKYVQSPLGRVLKYGTFEIESAGQDQALRRVKNLPNPNELYLRIVEEMYEPEAVEARLTTSAAIAEDDGT